MNTGMCPHYIEAGVNLFHGQFTSPQLANLSRIISNIIDNHAILACEQADDLGNQMLSTNIRTVRYIEWCQIQTNNNGLVFSHTTLNKYLPVILYRTSDLTPEEMCIYLGRYLQTVRTHALCLPFPLREECFRYTSKRVLSVLESTAASCCIHNGYGVPRNLLSLFESSLDTDVASSRLKLASFLVCHNELERAADVLNDVERRYDDSVQDVWECGRMDPFDSEHHKPLYTTSVDDNDDVLLTNNTALCVRFFRHEVFCAPPSLRFEMVRGIGEDVHNRDIEEPFWMNCAVVDALPYLYYLQYLTFGGLRQRRREVQAFNNLKNCFLHNPRSRLYHLETSANLFGHCLEIENQPEIAFLHYSTCTRECNPLRLSARGGG
ncbi:hypothetical protein MAR_001897 [Mya arenaria]|uniref:Uncharacterized protein n=1 Tax=Mya arenaria TaxID=6604 RepID=A0ABY7FGQ7_MYAAR|nr:hypothetical protein MAR_001897 [Mya arenaria]